ncbi:MAG TPA: MBL fold metallo-hydrolase [Opitutus sp.]|nr:MBL fold metallo-hydrolase [Opitutus sp.]
MLLVFWIFCAASAGAHADEIQPSDSVVTGVVIRAAPTTSSDRLGLLRPEETLLFVSDRPGWNEVSLRDGRTGFVSKRWTIRIESEEPGEDPFPITEAAPAMFAHFVYVGQGAGAILEFPCGVAVIDTGGQYTGDPDGGESFNTYLDGFFAAHPQYQNTIDVLFTSHPHLDHLAGLGGLLVNGALRYRVRNVVDNGQSGSGDSVRRQMNYRVISRARGAGFNGVSVTSALIPNGVTNPVIDPIPRIDPEYPIRCEGQGVDPTFRVFWGGWERDTVRELGGRGRYHSKPNNHSLVIRIDYGEASFLFTGDLETPAIEDMLTLYQDHLSNFDVDVYHVGHHGADNATTAPFLAAMSPQMAIISMGDLVDTTSASAPGHGHPRVAALRLLQNAVSGARIAPVTEQAFETEHDLVDVRIDRAIYATGWQHDIVLRADARGDFSFDHVH